MSTTTTTVVFDQITEPGTYVCNWNGHLLQVPDCAFNGGNVCVNLYGNDELFVTKISDKWNIQINEARDLAKNCDCKINF